MNNEKMITPEDLPEPSSIVDIYHKYLTGTSNMTIEQLPLPRKGFRTEEYLYYLCQSGGIGGGGSLEGSEINDAAISTTRTWSSNKTKKYTDEKVMLNGVPQNLDFKEIGGEVTGVTIGDKNYKFPSGSIEEFIIFGGFKLGNPTIQDTIQGGSLNRATTVKILLKKDNVVTIQDNLFSKYKFAIDKSGDGKIEFIQHPTTGLYHTTDYIITEDGSYNFMFALINGANFSETDLQEINTKFGAVVCGSTNGELEKKITELSTVVESSNVDLSMLKTSVGTIMRDFTKLGVFEHGNLAVDDTIIKGNLNRLSLVKVELESGDVVGFLNNLKSKYKFAIDKSGDGKIEFINGGYITTGEYTITETGFYNFMVTLISNNDFSENDIIEVINNFGITSQKSRITDLEKSTNEINNYLTSENRLYGKNIVAIGDSFVDAATVGGGGKDFLSKIANRNNMKQWNYGLSSSSLAYENGETVVSVIKRYKKMIQTVPDADYVLVLAGHNDSNPNLHGGKAIPIGQNTDKIETTFKGALNILIDDLITAYPLARILFLTPFNRRKTEQPYADAMKEVCALYSIPCFDNYRESGVCFSNATQKSKYDVGNLHLNDLGNEFVSYKYESILRNM